MTPDDDAEKLSFIEEFQYLLAVNFKWKCISPLPQQSEKTPIAEPEIKARTPWFTRMWSKQPQVLGKLDLEIALERSVPKGLERDKSFAVFNEQRLSDAACRPKIFTVTIERGNFVPTPRVGHYDSYYKYRYEFRLLFDKTLVPPQEEFIDPKLSIIDGVDWWTIKDYVGGKLPESAAKQSAMNDPSSPNSSWGCVVS